MKVTTYFLLNITTMGRPTQAEQIKQLQEKYDALKKVTDITASGIVALTEIVKTLAEKHDRLAAEINKQDHTQ